MIKPIRVKILKCSVTNDWYSNSIGQEYFVRHFNELYFWVVGAAVNGAYKILKTDCEVINGQQVLCNPCQRSANAA